MVVADIDATLLRMDSGLRIDNKYSEKKEHAGSVMQRMFTLTIRMRNAFSVLYPSRER
jgi:hypothetical protein